MVRMVRGGICVLAILCLAWPCTASSLLPQLDLSTPRSVYATLIAERDRAEALFIVYRNRPTVETFADLTQRLIRLGMNVFDLSHLPPATAPKEGVAALGVLADILNRLPPVPLDSIPGAPGTPAANLPARWNIPGTELQLVRIAEGPRAGDYVFSASTLARLPLYHRLAMRDPLQRETPIPNWTTVQQRFTGPLLAVLPLDSLPEPLQATLLGAPLWKILLALTGVALILGLVLTWMKLVRRLSAPAPPWRQHLLRLTVPLLLAGLVQLGHGFNMWQLVLGGVIGEAEIVLATLALYLAAAWAAWTACWFLAEAVIASPVFPDNIYDANLLRLAARVASLASAGTLIILGANEVGVPGVGLLAGVSIGGVALALAAQSTVENLFGGVSIFADRPFRVGDSIRYGGAEGRVESIGPRSSRIRGADGTLTTVPNADLAKMHVTNITSREKFLFRHRIGLRYGPTPDRLRALTEELQTRIAAHRLVESGPGLPRVRLVSLGDTSIEIEINAHVLTTDMREFLEIQEELILEIIGAVEDSGIRFAASDPGMPVIPQSAALPDQAKPA